MQWDLHVSLGSVKFSNKESKKRSMIQAKFIQNIYGKVSMNDTAKCCFVSLSLCKMKSVSKTH